MRNWLSTLLNKEARRFKPEDRVRYFTDSLKGKGKGVVLSPSFSKGQVVDFDSSARRYKVLNDSNEEVFVHPRNIVPDNSKRPSVAPEIQNIAPEIPDGTDNTLSQDGQTDNM